ncbi:hypothetical protein CkaCkLH20_02610 [Colletotrichum karsti]|uniref:Nab2-like CCCH zinc finger domain-containing protein n=1 Tax=Colletotrichum karsti TaxID=1095194 RepID=A0A9P6IBJ0_9PEZI|nr:uncharacterized protein CkaCkLH20_02610 [Colletotrichum karsti]KAF9879799.1 hypothetical protein CkaCkLH20_02610 [Colletotrichum karsti]
MTVQVVLNTPLADSLTKAIQPKLVEAGWASDDGELAEYIILMLVNGRTQDQIAHELATDLLGLDPADPACSDFASWLFQQAEQLNAQLNGSQAEGSDAMAGMTQQDASSGDMDTDMGANDANELNAPTGPRSMRNGPNARGAGRDKRMLGHMSKAMDRSGDSVLHRTRGNDRINSHGRGPPSGPRGGMGGRGGRMNGRGVNIQAGLNAMAGMNGQQGPPGMNGMNGGWGMPGAMAGGMPGGMPGQQHLDLMAMMEQQQQMMNQLQHQLMNQAGGRGGRRGGKSLFDRTQNRNNFKNRQPNDRSDSAMTEGGAEGEDVDMGQTKRDPPNPDDTVCKWNLQCTRKDCPYAHQSPVAPPGITIDLNDVCTFGAACMNRKCVGRHPSKAARLAHQGEQDCKFFPKCANPRCPFRHPDMPLCRNGGGCTTPGCKFTHVKTKCKFNPCMNPHCIYTHEEGQQGAFKDKVWTADDGDHVSERQFVDAKADPEVILPESEAAVKEEQGNFQEEVIS